jgi:hypothetical protein
MCNSVKISSIEHITIAIEVFEFYSLQIETSTVSPRMVSFHTRNLQVNFDIFDKCKHRLEGATMAREPNSSRHFHDDRPVLCDMNEVRCRHRNEHECVGSDDADKYTTCQRLSGVVAGHEWVSD